jgi:virulence factor Mce-like protein
VRLPAAILALALLAGCGAAKPRSYRVDVIFDTAKGVLPGQQVKIAGVHVGLIRKVSLTPDYKARIALDVDPRFAPFRADARCSLQPEGLIGERFVQCDPGTPDAGELGGSPPTVPVDHTTLPVGLSDLFNLFDVPSSQRLTLLLSGLGAGVAGRGRDLNAILRRSNPALLQVRRVLGKLDDQRAALRSAVRDSDTVLAALAARRRSVQSFIDHAAGAGERAASERDALEATVRDLPPLLEATRPALRRLDGTARALTPVLRDARAAAVPLDETLRRLPAFADAANPALRRLGAAAVPGLRFARDARAPTALLRRFAALGLPSGRLLNRLLVELRDAGFVEGLLSFLYNSGAVIALHDDVSHIGPSLFGPAICQVETSAGCTKPQPDDAPSPTPTPTATAQPQRRAPSAPPAPQVAAPAVPHVALPALTPIPQTVKDLLDSLLR